MKLRPFALERYFAKYEFSVKSLLSSSDCQTMPMARLLDMAGERTRALWDSLSLGYTESAGHPLLRQAVAELHDGLGPENILTAAPEEGIFIFMNALLEPGDHVICLAPSYQSLHEVGRALGCEVSDWTLDEDREWAADLDELERLLKPNTRLVVINFPHNPTGALPGEHFLEDLVRMLKDREIHLFSDEMYRFLELDGRPPLPPACVLYDQAVCLGGLSKAFGLPGLRIGWIATRDKALLKRMACIKDYTTICQSAPSEILALMALENRDAILAASRSLVGANLKALEDFMERHAGMFSWVKPKGGPVCFPRMTSCNDTLEFCEKMVSKMGVMLVPSAMFQFGSQHVRIGLGREDLPGVLQDFSQYLASESK